MSIQKNLITLCFAAVFTLGLAACGGGGGDAPVTGMPDTPDTIEPIEPEAHACDADAGPSQACVDARQADLEAIENDSDATVGELNAAQTALATAQTALADADTAAAEEMTVSGLVDDAMTATADITDESTLAEVAVGRAAIDAAQESLQGMENLSADATTTLQDLIDVLEAGYSPIEMTVATNAKTAAAATKRTEIAAEARETDADDAGLGGSLPPDVMESTYSMTILRGRDATKVMIADTANAGEDDPKFIDQDAGLDGGRTMHVRAMEADADGNVVTEVVIVATDIDEPTATLFAKVAGQELNAAADGAMATGDDADDAVAFDPGEALNSDDDAQAAILANIMASDFAAAVGTTVVHTFDAAVEDTAGTPDVDESKDAAEVAGTYNGAMGTYTCSGTTDCTVTVNDKGMLTAASNGWIFTPAMGATSDVPDADCLHYGFWLKKTTAKRAMARSW